MALSIGVSFVDCIEIRPSIAFMYTRGRSLTISLFPADLASVPDYANAIPALLSLRDSVVVTRVRKYISVPTAMSYEAHAEMHSKLAESSVDYPHSFAAYPVLKDVDDKNSDIVALVGGAYAWDQALNALLPSGVKGIHAIISNDCNQTYTYVINGVDALFRGEGDMHEQQFDHMRVSLSLAIYNNPNITSTPGHCMFTMVRQKLWSSYAPDILH